MVSFYLLIMVSELVERNNDNDERTGRAGRIDLNTLRAGVVGC